MVTKTEETEEVETEEPLEKASIKDAVIDVLTDLGIIRDGKAKVDEPEEAATEEPEEIESPRQQESRMRHTVEAAMRDLHIHVDTPREKEKAEKKEPEQVPGKKPWLSRVIGLDA